VLCYWVPQHLTKGSIFSLYLLALIKKWITIVIYITIYHETITYKILIRISLLSFLPLGLITFFFPYNTNIVYTGDIFVNKMLPSEHVHYNEHPAEAVKRYGRFNFKDILNELYDSLTENLNNNTITQQSMMLQLDTTIRKLGMVNFRPNLHFQDLLNIKYASTLADFSPEAQTILKGLSNNQPVTTVGNSVSTRWAFSAANKRTVLGELQRIKALEEARFASIQAPIQAPNQA